MKIQPSEKFWIVVANYYSSENIITVDKKVYSELLTNECLIATDRVAGFVNVLPVAKIEKEHEGNGKGII